MVTREEFLNLFDFPQDALDMINEDQMFDTWFSRTIEDCHGMISMDQFKKLFDADGVSNFVYYRPARVVFNTLVPANHERFMSGLYNLHQLKMGKRETSDAHADRKHLENMFCGKWDGQDLYLKECLGVYQSSCAKDCYRHEKFEFNAEEYEMFGFLVPYIYKF